MCLLRGWQTHVCPSPTNIVERLSKSRHERPQSARKNVKQPAAYSVTLLNKSQHLSRQREVAQQKGEREPRSLVHSEGGFKSSWGKTVAPSGPSHSSPAFVVGEWGEELPFTFLNTAGSGRGGPKKGTSSLAVTET